MTDEAQTPAERAENEATPRRSCDATDWCTNHGTLPARVVEEEEWDIDLADVCELGSLEALKQFQRQCEAERYDW